MDLPSAILECGPAFRVSILLLNAFAYERDIEFSYHFMPLKGEQFLIPQGEIYFMGAYTS